MEYAGATTAIRYVPRYVAVDGSGATLTARYAHHTSYPDPDESAVALQLAYDPVYDQFCWAAPSDHWLEWALGGDPWASEWAAGWPGTGAGYHPARQPVYLASNHYAYGYGPHGQILVHTDFEGQATASTYDNSAAGQGRLTGEYSFLAGVVPFDGTGNVREAYAAQGVEYTYDARGRTALVSQLVDDVTSRQTTYTYDPQTQQVASVASPEGTIHHDYDPATGDLLRTYT